MKNRNFAKLIETSEKQTIEYAPASLVIVGRGLIGNPSKAEYLTAGWKEVIDVKPEQKAGFYI